MLLRLYCRIITAFKSDEGATAVEYGVMVALIAFVILLVVAALGTKLGEIFKGVKDSIGPGTQVAP